MVNAPTNPKRQRSSIEGEKELRQTQKSQVLFSNTSLNHLETESSPTMKTSVQLPSSADIKRDRKLCSGVHCFAPEEKNVFSPLTPTVAPRTDTSECASDGQGNYGTVDGPSFRTVNYRYQVETTPELTAMLLNLEVLQDVEKAISDALVKRFFLETCSPPVINVIPRPYLQPPEAAPMVLAKAAATQQEDGHKRRLKSEYHQNLVGLSAAPEDLVLEGSAGEACPFPTTSGPCFVVGGAVTMFGDNAEGSGDGLMWIDEGIHEELQESMNSGDLEETVQPDHPGIVAIRYIPPGTDLPTDASNPDGVDSTPLGGRSQALSWVLIGLGVIILLGVFFYTIRNRRQAKQEQERTAAVVGAFPVVVSKQGVSQVQAAQNRDEAMSKRVYDMSSPQYISAPPDLLGRHHSESDDSEGDEEIPLHVFQDDDTAPSRALPQGVSTSWRDQILRNSHEESGPFGGGISLDPNQPFVRPILDEEADRNGYQSSHSSSEYHSVYSGDGYGSSYYAGSSTDSHTRYSPERRSPSKLTAAFDQSEII